MTGLLLKDFYTTAKYCRSFLFIVLVFLAVSFFSGDSANTFFTFYPIILSSMIPASLLAYDDAEKWTIYSQTLPCTRAQLVSCKYITGLLSNLTVLLIMGIRFTVFSPGEGDYLSLLTAALIIGITAQAVILPFLFKFGAQKGRIIYISVIMLFCIGCSSLSLLKEIPELSPGIGASQTMFVIASAAILLYAASWLLSIAFYKKRQL